MQPDTRRECRSRILKCRPRPPSTMAVPQRALTTHSTWCRLPFNICTDDSTKNQLGFAAAAAASSSSFSGGGSGLSGTAVSCCNHKEREKMIDIFKDGPIEHKVASVSLANEEVTKELSQISVIGFVFEAKRTDVIQVGSKLSFRIRCIKRNKTSITLAQNFHWGCHLLLADLVIFLTLIRSFESLPRQTSTIEIH